MHEADHTAPMTAPAGASTLHIERGACYAVFVHDVGFSVDLEEAARRISAQSSRQRMRHRHRAPQHFEYQPPPLHLSQSLEPIAVGSFRTDGLVNVVLYDFGAVSTTFRIPLSGPLANLLHLSGELWDHTQLHDASRRLVNSLADTMSAAITKPGVADLVEDYTVYQIEALDPPQDVKQLLRQYRLPIAQILRAESTPLSQQEIDDALGCQIAFGPDDRAVIDWNATVLFDTDAEDVRAVLEFANVELLELRYLDDRLDDALDQAYEAMSHRSRLHSMILTRQQSDLSHIAGLQMEGALLYEAVTNALKLLGDQYLARVYRLASRRFHLHDWNASILRKLQTLESIYEKTSDRLANRRLELLEWIIIILIAVSILISLWPGLAH